MLTIIDVKSLKILSFYNKKKSLQLKIDVYHKNLTATQSLAFPMAGNDKMNTSAINSLTIKNNKFCHGTGYIIVILCKKLLIHITVGEAHVF